MAVSGKTAAPHEIPYCFGTDKPPDMSLLSRTMAERIHEQFDAIAPKQITGVAKKQLLIANASGVVTAVTASGHITNDESGKFTIAALPGARVKRSGEAVKIKNRGEFTPIKFDAEDWDNEGMHSLSENTARLVCVTPGVYIVHGMAQFSGPASGGTTSEAAKGDRVAALVKNGSPASGPLPGKNLVEFSVPGRTSDPTLPGSGGNSIAVSAPCQMKAGDYVELWVWQNSEAELQILSGDGLHEPFLSAVFQHS